MTQPVNIQKEVSPTAGIDQGHTVVGAAAVQITPQSLRYMRGVVLRTPGPDDAVPNTNTVWIGDAKVTANSAVDTGGFPLLPGASIRVPIDDTSALYAISDAAAQDLAWIGV